jgi:hypothetical protein
MLISTVNEKIGSIPVIHHYSAGSGNICDTGSASSSQTGVYPDLSEASVQDLQQGMEAGNFTSIDLVKACFLFQM